MIWFDKSCKCLYILQYTNIPIYNLLAFTSFFYSFYISLITLFKNLLPFLLCNYAKTIFQSTFSIWSVMLIVYTCQKVQKDFRQSTKLTSQTGCYYQRGVSLSALSRNSHLSHPACLSTQEVPLLFHNPTILITASDSSVRLSHRGNETVNRSWDSLWRFCIYSLA